MPVLPANTSNSDFTPMPFSDWDGSIKAASQLQYGRGERSARLPVTEKAIAQVGRALLTTRAWLTRYGAPHYGILLRDTRVVEACSAWFGGKCEHTGETLTQRAAALLRDTPASRPAKQI